eukprot:TRINITY_DN10802_c0_g1_i1.p1 TRINITY_DN10802_c0_g1~~TRINITY_DN10802_c0_g1_i1.p1  ORF type:complete len:312 (-),score=83.76 TRINITY_DN10802_c0_g1_i1:18-953(-)
MMKSRPWNAVLSSGRQRDQVTLEAAKIRATSPNRPVRAASTSDATPTRSWTPTRRLRDSSSAGGGLDGFLGDLDVLFNAADTGSGQLEAAQVLALVQQLLEQHGNGNSLAELPAMLSNSLEEHLGSAHSPADRAALLKLLSAKRWRRVLPIALHDALLLASQRTAAPAEGVARASSPSRRVRVCGWLSQQGAKQRLLELSSLLQALTVHQCTDSSITLSWAHVCCVPGAALPEYTVHMASNGEVSTAMAVIGPEEYAHPGSSTLQNGRILYTLMRLKPNTKYKLRVTGRTWKSAPAEASTLPPPKRAAQRS